MVNQLNGRCNENHFKVIYIGDFLHFGLLPNFFGAIDPMGLFDIK
jgi:ATP-dependent protease Clp ATPase subunit